MPRFARPPVASHREHNVEREVIIARAERRAQRVSAIVWCVVDVAAGVWLAVVIGRCAG